MKTIAIIGGGAAGLMAAYAASRTVENSVILYERQARVGRKLLATGNGRCNLTNLNAGVSHYHGADPAFVRPALEALSVADTLALFHDLGLLTVEGEGGRMYPLSDSANSVLDVLRFAIDRENVTLKAGEPVLSVQRTKKGFLVETETGKDFADEVIVACGGCAGSKLGGVNDGYTILQSLGHSRTTLHPALTQITSDSPYPRSLKGVRAQAALTLERKGRVIAVNRGEVQFTEKGISGIAVFELSREVSTGGACTVALDFLPDYTVQQIQSMLTHRMETAPHLSTEDLFTGILHNKLGRTICRAAGVSAERIGSLTGKDLSKCAKMCKDFRINAIGTGGFDAAQVTAGGIKTSEFDPRTMESRIVPGLFACGEVLDIDGDCGGFNLQWAWSSGAMAGGLHR
ncbi:MAG: aminoacetone oxidase family FAD-binding enzyme [Oscillospiraceae bacterium]|nr:aminoacetone oxidase family FAD-binding enzyme [Oscillospiraceae bacterium]